MPMYRCIVCCLLYLLCGQYLYVDVFCVVIGYCQFRWRTKIHNMPFVYACSKNRRKHAVKSVKDSQATKTTTSHVFRWSVCFNGNPAIYRLWTGHYVLQIHTVMWPCEISCLQCGQQQTTRTTNSTRASEQNLKADYNQYRLRCCR